MITLTLLCLALGEPPQAPPLRLTYAEFRSRVERLQPGETLTLTVGMQGENRCDSAKTHGIDAGVYTCWFDGTQAKMQRIGQPAATNANVTPNVYLWYNSSCPGGNCPLNSRR